MEPENEQEVPITQHVFELYSYKTPTNCKHCNQMLMGFRNQGLKCRRCDMNVHKACQEDLDKSCVTLLENHHNFRVKSFKTPTFCDCCSRLIWGFAHQGMKCTECKANVHHYCHGQINHDCGKVKYRLQTGRSETTQLLIVQ